jgi:hypothetical protein
LTKGTKTTDKGHGSASPLLESRSALPGNEEGFIPQNGGYQELLSYTKPAGVGGWARKSALFLVWTGTGGH